MEQVMLRRLAVFVGHFTIDAALAVVTSATVGQELVFGIIDGLVAKSLVATRPVGAMMRYRLLDTTRAYALDISIDNAELAELSARHATYYRGWLEQVGAQWPRLSITAERAPLLDGVNNARAALEWCFGIGGDAESGVALAAAAMPVLTGMSLLTECQRWSERAIQMLKNEARGGADEMHLQAGLGLSLMFTRGNSEAVHLALTRALVIAENRGEVLDQVQLLNLLRTFHERIGGFRTALSYAKRSIGTCLTIQNPDALARVRSLLGISLHHIGELNDARVELQAALQHGPGPKPIGLINLNFDVFVYAGAVLAKTLWLQGYPDQALERARQTVRDAEARDHPITLSIALTWAASLFLCTGDLQSADHHADRLISHSESHSLAPYVAVGRGFKGELAIRTGDPNHGVQSLQNALESLHEVRYELLTAAFNISLAQGLAEIGRLVEGITLIENSIRMPEINDHPIYMPELLRVKGALLLSEARANRAEAEKCFLQSLEMSRLQGARAWELRAATDLAGLLAGERQASAAKTILRSVVTQFVEGSDTADLKAAQDRLAALG
jgi:predicted ATPase